MDKKKLIIIFLIIIFLVACVILISSQNNTIDSDNYNSSKNNTTKNNNVSNDTINNRSLYGNQITKSGKNVISRINNNQTMSIGEKSNQLINFNKKNINRLPPTNNSNNDNDSNLLEVTAEDIKKCGERIGWNGKYGEEVIVGEPYLWSNYESGREWLVPAFDKITGEFIGSVYIWAPYHKNGDGTFGTSYMMGPSSYSNYLDLLAGKPITKPEIIIEGGPENFTLNLTSFSDSQDVGGYSMMSDAVSDVGASTELMEYNIDLSNSSNSCCE